MNDSISSLLLPIARRAATRYASDVVQRQAVLAEEKSGICRTLDYLDVLHDLGMYSELLIRVAPALERSDDSSVWLPYLQRAVGWCRKTQNVGGEVRLTMTLGELHTLRDEYREAEVAFRHSHTLFLSLEQPTAAAHCLTRLASVLRRQGYRQEARHYVEQALAVKEPNHDTLGFAHYVLGSIALDEGAWLEAEVELRQTLHYWEAGEASHLHAWGWVNLAVSLTHQKRFTEAEDFYQRAIVDLTHRHDLIHAAVARMNLGNIYLTLEQYDNALPLYETARLVFDASFSRRRLAMVLNSLGMVFRKLHLWEQARKSYSDSITLWRALDV